MYFIFLFPERFNLNKTLSTPIQSLSLPKKHPGVIRKPVYRIHLAQGRNISLVKMSKNVLFIGIFPINNTFFDKNM